MKTTYDVEQRAIGWTVVRVDTFVIPGRPGTYAFRTTERWFLRFSRALSYATRRAGSVLDVQLAARRAA